MNIFYKTELVDREGSVLHATYIDVKEALMSVLTSLNNFPFSSATIYKDTELIYEHLQDEESLREVINPRYVREFNESRRELNL